MSQPPEDHMIAAHPITDRDAWNDLLRLLPGAHVLQTWEWGEFKRRTTGWTPERLAYRRGDETLAAAQVLTRRVGPLRVMYVPRGPALDYADRATLAAVLAHLQGLARARFAIWLKIDPEVSLATGVPGEEDDTPAPTGQAVVQTLRDLGWRQGGEVQFRNTITVDLARPADDILMEMRQSTRRKVRTAEKKDVIIRAGTPQDIPTLYELTRLTGERDEFLTRPLDYYRAAWGSFMEAGMAHALIAEYDGQPLAHVVLLHFSDKCWYTYGASSNEERQRMPNYALQWQAMQWAQAQGYRTYDFRGAPDVFDESDRMWGVWEFKRGFGGTVQRFIGAWDYVPYPPLYWAYERLMPRVLATLRRSSQESPGG
ncbi:MAG: peptidoglycan bridge formation glycyltransferase FemA/FemB family protein [Anaerolineae bacterium]|nr:peptidoglycan bridge formation glycyltransferase FemA/FemB family protein [Anaerolineae bacterium]